MMNKRVRFEEMPNIQDRRWLLEHLADLDVDSEEELEELYRATR